MIISAVDGYEIPNILRDLKKFTSVRILDEIKSSRRESRRTWMLQIFKRNGRKNYNNRFYQLWQQNYHPIKLNTNHLMNQKLEYIHNNPVKAGFLNDPVAWSYSSAGSYARLQGLLDIEFMG
jgi:putative transposase